jgi:hypothetical protein
LIISCQLSNTKPVKPVFALSPSPPPCPLYLQPAAAVFEPPGLRPGAPARSAGTEARLRPTAGKRQGTGRIPAGNLADGPPDASECKREAPHPVREDLPAGGQARGGRPAAVAGLPPQYCREAGPDAPLPGQSPNFTGRLPFTPSPLPIRPRAPGSKDTGRSRDGLNTGPGSPKPVPPFSVCYKNPRQFRGHERSRSPARGLLPGLSLPHTGNLSVVFGYPPRRLSASAMSREGYLRMA